MSAGSTCDAVGAKLSWPVEVRRHCRDPR
jgi:hypothetical protein